MSGLDSYANGRKKNWRGWQWNRIVERLMVPVEDATVLYLCGPDDFDREKALARGFRNENLIAVDLDENHVRAVRAGGGLAIAYDVNELLRAWPSDWPVHAVVADFCCGLGTTAYRLVHALIFSGATSSEAHPCVVAVNLQRGRDAQSNNWRDMLTEVFPQAGAEWEVDPRKHRGSQFVVVARHALAKAVESYCAGRVGYGYLAAAGLISEVMQPAYNTYRSRMVYMDSVVMRWPGSPYANTNKQIAAARRKIAACRALRTTMLKRDAA